MNVPAVASSLAVLLAPLTLFGAQPPRQPDAARLGRAVERLSVVGRVLYVAAHPDDENTRLLAWLANEKLVRAAYLSVTRGDGGQNLIGSEQGALLGVIRTQELLAARRVDGAEQMFTRARDFGYSKTPEETLAIWGHDEVLADVVWAIRRFKPDVIVTRFPAKGLETHGHHTASAILAEEAFRSAADPAYHPEQVALVGAWQARRIVLNKPTFGAKPGEEFPGFVALDVGTYNPSLGLSCGELAADSRSMHKSQGFGVPRQRGPALEWFQVTAGEPFSPQKGSFLDGVDLSWARVPGAQKLAALLMRAHNEYQPTHPESILPTLAAAHAELARLPEGPYKQEKLDEIVEVMVACAGLHLDATAADPVAVPGGTVALTVNALDRSFAAVKLLGVHFPDGTSAPAEQLLAPGKPFTLERAVTIGLDARASNPYWLDEPPTPGLYTVKDPQLVGLPESPPALTVSFDLVIAGEPVSPRRTVYFTWTDPVAGERYRGVEVTPPVTLVPSQAVLLFADGKARELRVRLKSAIENAHGDLMLELPEGWKAEPAKLPFTLGARGAEADLAFSVKPPAHGARAEGTLRAVAIVDGKRLDRGLLRIEYPHIPIQTLFPRAEVKLVRFELAKGKTRIGYIAGAGDEVPAALRQVGYDVTLLSDERVRDEPLGAFDAIVVGVRAFNVNPRLPYLHEQLMSYVANGGTLLVQYNTNNRISKLPTEIGPFPFTISQDRVTDEKAAVTVLTPHAVLARPNAIVDGDWDGWVQERGLYFAGTWDARYETPLAMNDPKEPPRKGSLIIANHGKGAFIYTGLAFFRELPAGVPGAFRLFANLLAYKPGKRPRPR